MAKKKAVQEVIETPKVSRKKLFIAIGVGVLTAFLLYSGRSLFVAATVNGQPISRLLVVQELEKQLGRDALDSQITNVLVRQEARNQGVEVTDEELAQEVEQLAQTLAAQGQDLDTLLSLQGMDRSTLEEQLRIQLLVEKLLSDKVEISEEEIDEFLAENEDLLPAEGDSREAATNQIRQQKLSSEYQTWIQELKEKANINYWVEY